MSDENGLPLRPDPDPEVLAKQLKHSLSELRGQSYQGYLAQLIRNTFLGVQDGNLESPQRVVELLAPALHLAERLGTEPDAVEAAAWMKATSRFLQVANEALRPRLTVETLLSRDRSDTEREVLQILLREDKQPLRRGEIAARWNAEQPAPTTMRIGQILANLHEAGVLVRVKQPARGGNDVAFYRLSRLGRELCERLDVTAQSTEAMVIKAVFYNLLRDALSADTTTPLLFTTFVDLDAHPTAQKFHEDFIAQLPNMKRQVEWIFFKSKYFDDRFWPAIQRHPGRVKVFLRETKDDLEPTIQVLGNGGCIYPIADDVGLATNQDIATATWKKHQAAARPLN
jgi:hypothetical protein